MALNITSADNMAQVFNNKCRNVGFCEIWLAPLIEGSKKFLVNQPLLSHRKETY